MRTTRTILVTAMVIAAPTAVNAVAAPAYAAKSSHTLSVHTTRTHHLTVAGRTRPGITHVRDTGPLPIQLFARKSSGVRTLVADLNTALRRNNSSALQRHFTRAGEIDGGFDGYLPLRRGTYYIVDAHFDNTRYSASQVATVTVSGDPANTPVPTADRITIGKNGDVHPASMSRKLHYVRLVNADYHEVAVAAVRVPSSVSRAKLNRFLAHPSFSHLIDVSPSRRGYPDYGIAQAAPAAETVTLSQFLRAGRFVVLTARYVNGHLQDRVPRSQVRTFTVR